MLVYSKVILSQQYVVTPQIAQSVEDTLVRTLVGPADTGVYSKSVQETLYNMGQAVLEAEPSISSVLLLIHY